MTVFVWTTFVKMVSYLMYLLIKNENDCVLFSGTTNFLSMTVNMMICAMSMAFAILVKIGIDEVS